METALKKVLVVDDDEEMCEELAGILEDEGYQVTSVSEGSIGKKLLGKNAYDLVMLDIKMPGINGIELLRHIKEKKIPGKVIMITGGAEIDESSKAVKVAIPESEQEIIKLADAIIGKPFDVENILDTIRKLIGCGC